MEILMYGPRKAGTTLFQRLLDGSGIFVHPRETKIKKYVSSENISQPKELFPLLSRPEVEGFFHEKYEQKIIDSLSSIKSLKEFVDIDVEAAALAFEVPVKPTSWAIKEVGGDPLCIINHFFESYPEGKVLIINRDYRLITKAIINNRKQRNLKLTITDKLKIAFASYQITKQINELPLDSRVYIIQYELLVSESNLVMRNVAKFLGIKFNKIMLQPTMYGREHQVHTASRPGNRVFTSNSNIFEGLNFIDQSILSIVYMLIRWSK